MNRLTRLTITGADDGVTPADLVDFAREAPFVEWGILVSETRTGTARYPSLPWLAKLADAMATAEAAGVPRPAVAMHVCGRWARDLLTGAAHAPATIVKACRAGGFVFRRLQINGTVPDEAVSPDLASRLREIPVRQDTIFQIGADGRTRALEVARAGRIACASLFDASGGKGVSPSLWPLPIPGVPPGWAGGLAPWNIADVVHGLERMGTLPEGPADVDFWVDMETGARTTDVFDWNKVRAAVEAVRPYVKPTTEKPQ